MAQFQQAVGRSSPYVDVPPVLIVAQRAPTSTDTNYVKGQGWLDESASPAALYTHIGGGTWDQGGNSLATTTVPGIVLINTDGTLAGADNSDVPTSLAVKTYADSLVSAGAPVATETTAGIGELATDAEAVAGTPSTGALALFVTPSNLAAVMAAPGAIGGTTPAAGTFTDLTADGTLDLDTTVAGHIKVTGAADFTVESTLGSVILNGEEAVDDAIQLTSVAGGLSVSVGLSAVIASSEANADSVQLTSGGGMDITATGAAGKDLDIVSTSGSVNITAGENIANSMVLTNKGMDIAIAGAAGQDFDLVNTGGSVNITATENVADAIVINAPAGGIDITNTGTAGEDIDIASSGASVNLSSTENAALALYLHANGGTSETIRLRSDQGTGANSIEFISDVGGILSQSGLDSANAIYLHADAGTSETIKIHSDQGTGVASVEVASDVGGVTISSGLASADAINLNASDAGGGIDVDCGSAGFIVDAASGPISLDGGLASNFNVTGAGVDIDIGSASGRLILTAGEDAADAIYLHADAGTSEKIRLHSDQGTGLDSVELESDVGGVTVTAGVANAAAFDVNLANGGMTVDAGLGISFDAAGASNFSTSGAGIDLDLASAAGRVIVTAGEDAADAIYLHADAGTSEKIRLHSDQGTGNDSVILESDDGGITLTAGKANASAIDINSSNGGVDIDAALQINIASSQAATGALTLAVSDVAANITLTGAVACTPDSITGDLAGVAASINTGVTLVTTDGDMNEDSITLSNGLVPGQIKVISCIAAGDAADSYKITPASFSQGTKITFAADCTGKGASFVWDGSNWNCFSNNGGTIS